MDSTHRADAGHRTGGFGMLLGIAAGAIMSVYLMPPDSAAAAGTGDPEVVDHLQDYPLFVEAVRASEDAEAQRLAFDRYVRSSDPALHDAVIENLERIPDGTFSRIMEVIVAHDDEIRARHRMLSEAIPSTIARMGRIFDADFHGISSHVTLSLLSTNGQVRRHQGRYVVIYGVDAIAHQEGLFLEHHQPDLRVLVAHELFHVHHWARNAFMAAMGERFLPPRADAPIWANMWSEGLAACASRIVYPDAPIALVMSMEDIWSQTESRMAPIGAELETVLDSSEPDVTAEWFYLNNGRDDLPDKAAYVLGAIAAHDIVESIGLDAAVQLNGEALRQKIAGSVHAIAGGELNVGEEDFCVSDRKARTGR